MASVAEKSLMYQGLREINHTNHTNIFNKGYNYFTHEQQ
ncbi:hypothetical protein SBF1_2970006 [Candidatus Desulfosporosinus infrequens]|uniref:Uncharacterized protein n=1 Tax=Candidatus Desulfosporosinus infrequens TaxID=2043169 RepID=A0A2U3KWC9_9FIRM|nr:hypothetical protein SBF1_2970006 [Candidatus Desulfosporosinus infrequens]